MDTADNWKHIVDEAKAQVATQLVADERTPLVFGDPIAWSECRYGNTVGLSVAHRVGLPIDGESYTTCGEPIPAPVRRLPLSPNLIRSLGRCQFCETGYVAQVRSTMEKIAA